MPFTPIGKTVAFNCEWEQTTPCAEGKISVLKVMSAILKMTGKKAISAISKSVEIERAYYSELTKAHEYLRTPNKTLLIAARALEKLKGIVLSQDITLIQAFSNGMFDSVLNTYVAYNKQMDFEMLKNIHELTTTKLLNKISVLGKAMSSIEKYHAEKFENEILPIQAFEALFLEAGGKTLLNKLTKLGYEKGKQGVMGKTMNELKHEIEVTNTHAKYLSYSKTMQKYLDGDKPDIEKYNTARLKALEQEAKLVQFGKVNLLTEAISEKINKSIEQAKATTSNEVAVA